MSKIKKIKVDKLLHLEGIEIDLPNDENLIITGKNGTGKSVFLDQLKEKLPGSSRGRNNLPDAEISIEMEGNKKAIYSHFPALRQSNMIDPSKGDAGPDRMDTGMTIDKDPSNWFVKYIVDMHTKRTDAFYYWQHENDTDSEEKFEEYDKWFNEFKESLNIIFNDETIELTYNRGKGNFEIIQDGKLPYTLNQLSSGYSAIIKIVSNIILKMNKETDTNFDVEGVVLIDEIETHLHVSLQKIILPFLQNFFPNIQFIVTTHSPFVLTSVKDSIIFDLENEIEVEDLSKHSYSSIVESYFNTDEYSRIIKGKYERYLELKRSSISENSEDEIELHNLKKYFNSIPREWAEDMKLAFLLEENN